MMPTRFFFSKAFLAGFALVFIGLTAYHLRGSAFGAGVQPIAFNHAKHLASGLSCTDCHTTVQTGEHATIPTIDACMACHQVIPAKTPEATRLQAIAAAGKQLVWKPVTQVPTHVYFSHRRHAAIAKLECVTCHGAMEKLTAPPRRAAVALTMTACMDCHAKSQAGQDCNDCHR
jgi:hypothetical protein